MIRAASIPIAMLAAGLLWPAGSAAAAESPTREPVKLVRTLQTLQDQIAQGSSEAQTAQRQIIRMIAERFKEAESETWHDRSNTRAAVLYVLSGGNPGVLPGILETVSEPGDQALVKAAFAYASGRQAEAQTLWTDMDVYALPAGLAGAAALVKANLVVDSDPAQAMTLLDFARLQSPGGLVEEAALRRGISVAARLADLEKFEFLAIRYARRFPRSVYAAAFRQYFAASFLSFPGADDAGSFPRLEAILSSLEQEDQREVYLEVGRLALVRGNVALARFAADQATAIASASPAMADRARLYGAAAYAFTDDFGRARAELELIEPSRLPPQDADLHKAVLQVVRDIERWPDDPGGAQPPAAVPEADAPGTGISPAAAIVQLAGDAMANADRVLAEAAR